MAVSDSIQRLRAFLDEAGAGSIADRKRAATLLADCWEGLRVDDRTKMRADKLWRIEEPTWQPPVLEFKIERHGATVNGSSRAELHTWRADLDRGTAGIVEERRRQLGAMDVRLDVKPIAEELAAAIRTGTPDSRLRVAKDGSVSLKIGEIIPATNKQTTAGRRSRFRKALRALLEPNGWKEKRANCYAQEKSA